MTDSKRIYVDSRSGEELRRLLWLICYVLLFRYTPYFCCKKWRVFLLRLFGSQIGRGCKVAPTCRIWAPWNLSLGDFVCLADEVDCYSVDKIEIASYATVSQRAFLCSASHRIDSLQRPLTHKPIQIGEHAWICSQAFVGPGVNVGEGAVVGACAVVFKEVKSWKVVAGNPAKVVKDRVLKDSKL